MLSRTMYSSSIILMVSQSVHRDADSPVHDVPCTSAMKNKTAASIGNIIFFIIILLCFNPVNFIFCVYQSCTSSNAPPYGLSTSLPDMVRSMVPLSSGTLRSTDSCAPRSNVRLSRLNTPDTDCATGIKSHFTSNTTSQVPFPLSVALIIFRNTDVPS